MVPIFNTHEHGFLRRSRVGAMTLTEGFKVASPSPLLVLMAFLGKI